MENRVLWFEGQQEALFAPLSSDLEVDVAIIGAGMAGLHCAWRLRESGLRVALFEARQVGHQATGRSTAKVTSQHGLRYGSLKRSFGEENARIYAEANQSAVSLIAAICESMDGHFGLKPANAHVYATDERQAGQLEDEAKSRANSVCPLQSSHRRKCRCRRGRFCASPASTSSTRPPICAALPRRLPIPCRFSSRAALPQSSTAKPAVSSATAMP